MTIKQMMSALQLLHGMVEQRINLNGLERDQMRQATTTIQQGFLEFQQLQDKINKTQATFGNQDKQQQFKNSQQDGSAK